MFQEIFKITYLIAMYHTLIRLERFISYGKFLKE